LLPSLKFLFRLICWWLLFFFFFRILFLISEFAGTVNAPVSDLIKVFFWGFRLDLSAICYLIAFPFLLLVIRLFTSSGILRYLNLYFHGIVLFWFVGISLGNITLYKIWGTIINARAIFYLSEPKEVFASLSNFEWFISLSIWTLIFLFFFFLFRKFVQKKFPEPVAGRTISVIPFLVLFALIFLGARGGTQLIPINESSAYFSSNNLLNQIAVNHIWSLGHSLKESRISTENPYKYYDDATAQKNVMALYTSKKDSTEQIFNIDSLPKPNIVIIILESWSADIVKAIGGEDNLSPNFDQLKNDGILFSNIYSAGFRTDQGLVSILSGFPAQPNNSIIHYPDKTEKLPSLMREFKKSNYNTSFYYGGEIGFANMNSYFLNSGCDKLVTQDDFKETSHSNKWGVYDEFVLNRHAADLNHQKEPFFSVLLTLSTHEPFDIPIKNPFGNDTEADKFRGAAYYTDQSLGNYFKKVKEEAWFKNTLFVLIADHGHKLPKGNNYENPKARRMVMMFYGNLIKPEFKGKVFNRIANQNDFPATLLSQLGMKHDSFEWSNDIFNKNRNDFAYMSLDYGFNWLTPNGYLTWRFDSGKPNFPEDLKTVTDQDITNAESYLQCLYRKFLDY
jgi:phosphoglycerol transferase MdoB-like AlkP superfamily enzyme